MMDSELAEFFEEFRGRENQDFREFPMPVGTPRDLIQLGELMELTLSNGDVLTFDSDNAVLAADVDGNLYIGGATYAMPRRWRAGRKYYLGLIEKVVYRADKQHLADGDDEPIEWFHFFGEDGGKKPELFVKDSFYYIEGGDYRVTRYGVEG
jgi:hypothetical protein